MPGPTTEPSRRGAQRRPYVFSMRGELPAQPIPLASADDDGWFVTDWPDWSADGTRIVWGQGREVQLVRGDGVLAVDARQRNRVEPPGGQVAGAA
jgi:hypothetical protein